ncbi:MAG: hypothetical protein Hyperionvirus6_80 [Hyperionvirus sp.]|uniref:Uncharacterized protein n=1 Tax=Hyperionvirus sp. TaxID=2487770 RepID=A0A3G5ADF5_9VIRU|nr:MAG: hypothetical protein Hyperionvirus6_80 [Hyperionvirus sp.]
MSRSETKVRVKKEYPDPIKSEYSFENILSYLVSIIKRKAEEKKIELIVNDKDHSDRVILLVWKNDKQPEFTLTLVVSEKTLIVYKFSFYGLPHSAPKKIWYIILSEPLEHIADNILKELTATI